MRLKTLLAAAAMSIGLLAHAEGEVTLPNGTSFEDQQVGKIDVTTLTDATWTYAGDQQDIMAYEGGEDYKGRPTQFDGDSQENYLKINTPLTNGVKRAITAQTIDETKGFYVDTLVKFTAADDDLDIPTDGKVAVWVKAMDEDGAENHLMVTAGPVVDQKPTTYDCGEIADVDAWHRLTIKVIKSVTGDELINGVVVYVDGDQEQEARGCTDVVTYWQGAGVTLSANANEFAKNGRLFPAMSSQETISSLEFAGQGSIDDISLTDVAPAFAKDFQFYTVAWDDGVTGFTYTPDGKEPVVKSDLVGEGSETVVWDGENAPVIDVQSITVAERKMFKEIDTTVAATATIKVSDLVATGVIDGEAVSFSSVGAMETAINAAQTSANVTLGGDVNEDIDINNEGTATIVIDLAGKTVTASESAAINVTMGNVCITNSTVEVGVVDGNGLNAVANASGTVYMQAGKYIGHVDNYPDYSVCFGGKYTVAGNSEVVDDKTNCTLYLAPNKAVQVVTEDEVDFYEVIEAAPAATATVIFVCEKTGYSNEVPVTANEQYTDPAPDSATTVGSKTFYKVVAWKDGEGNAFAPFTPAADETYTFYADVDINLTVNGDGEYQVTQPADLVTLKDYVADGNDCAGKTFKQTQDIDLAGKVWEGIGTPKSTTIIFNGVYDGNGQTIKNITYARMRYNGLFGNLGGTAQVKNLTLTVAGIATTGIESGYGFGAVVGFTQGTDVLIENITVDPAVPGQDSILGKDNMAGIGARLEGKVTLRNCTNNLAISTTYSKIGGMCAIASNAQALGGVAFINCVNNATITGDGVNGAKDAGSDGIAGILGYIQGNEHNVVKKPLSFVNCQNNGTLQHIGENGTSTSANDKACIASFIAKEAGADYTDVTSSGNTAKADYRATTSGSAPDGLRYATVDDKGVATFIADAAVVKDGTYKVMAPGAAPVIALDLNDTITFVTNLCTATFGGVVVADDSAQKLDEVADATGVTFTCVAKGPVVPVDDDENLNEKGKENVAKVAEVFGEGLTDWVKAVYADGKIPAAKLNATTDELIAAAQEFNLPIMTAGVEVEVEAAAEGFTFKIVDGEPINVQAAYLQQLIKYTAALENDFGASTGKVDVSPNKEGTAFNAKFTTSDAAAGFMKVDMTVEK